MHWKALAASVALSGAAAGALGFFWPCDRPPVLLLHGTVEIQEVRLSSKVGGRVARVAVAEGDLVVTRLTAHGTHTGEYRGLEYKDIPPTGKQVTWTETSIDRIVDGKIVEAWFNEDALGRLQQIGALPTPGQAS